MIVLGAQIIVLGAEMMQHMSADDTCTASHQSPQACITQMKLADETLHRPAADKISRHIITAATVHTDQTQRSSATMLQSQRDTHA
jgi:hypothetical protein